MAKSDELIKYITQQVVTYIETPKDIRKVNRKALQGQKEPWKSKWFGMVPFAISMWFTQCKAMFRDKKGHPRQLNDQGVKDIGRGGEITKGRRNHSQKAP